MDINLDIILGTTDEWFICLFKNSKHAKDSPPHFHIIIPIKEENNNTCKTEKSFIVCYITSQIEKRENYYKNIFKNDGIKALVKISQKDFNFLTKDSIVECNKADIYNIIELIDIIENPKDFIIKPAIISEDLKNQIINAINISPDVRNYVKKILLFFR
jgi:hypothetical protein